MAKKSHTLVVENPPLGGSRAAEIDQELEWHAVARLGSGDYRFLTLRWNPAKQSRPVVVSESQSRGFDVCLGLANKALVSSWGKR